MATEDTPTIEGWYPIGSAGGYWTHATLEFDLNGPKTSGDGWEIEFMGDNETPHSERRLPVTPEGLRALADLIETVDRSAASGSQEQGDA